MSTLRRDASKAAPCVVCDMQGRFWNWHQRASRDLGPNRPPGLVYPMKWRCDVCDGLQFRPAARMSLARMINHVNSFERREAKQ